MTDVYREGDYQSVADKVTRQRIPGGRRWTALLVRLTVVRAGVQDFDYAIRVRPSGRLRFAAGKVWVREQRYPVVAGDNGTRWQGPIALPVGEAALYLAGGGMDRKGGELGHAYGIDVRATVPVIVDQQIAKLDPR